VIAFSALVQYNPGAVVSRTLLKKVEGSPRSRSRARTTNAVTPSKMILIMIRA
jgi:hypothetical protein